MPYGGWRQPAAEPPGRLGAALGRAGRVVHTDPGAAVRRNAVTGHDPCAIMPTSVGTTAPSSTEALERLYYEDLDASCHARHVDEAATCNLARDRLWCVVAMVE